MIQLTDYLGETLNIDETVIVTVSNYSQSGIAGSKVEYRVNPTSIAVIYVTDIPSAISGMTDYVVPITLVFDNGQTETIYINPAFYRGFLTLSPSNQLIYEYQIGTQYRTFATSTDYATIAAQISAISGGSSSSWSLTGNAGTDGTVNSIGTTDNTFVKFISNNIPMMALTPSNGFSLSTRSIFGGGATTYSTISTPANNRLEYKTFTASALKAYALLNGAADSVILGTNGQTQVIVDTSGNVGINQTTPTAKLEVAGDIKTVGIQYKVAEVIYGNNYTFSNDDYCLLVGLSGTGAVGVDLTDYTPKDGQVIVIKDAGGNALIDNIVITGTIDGASGLTLNTNNASVQLIYSTTAVSWFSI